MSLLNKKKLNMSAINEYKPFFLSQRIFTVPANPRQKQIPYARVNHNKYMVTDKVAYIGTAHYFSFLHSVLLIAFLKHLNPSQCIF